MYARIHNFSPITLDSTQVVCQKSVMDQQSVICQRRHLMSTQSLQSQTLVLHLFSWCDRASCCLTCLETQINQDLMIQSDSDHKSLKFEGLTRTCFQNIFYINRSTWLVLSNSMQLLWIYYVILQSTFCVNVIIQTQKHLFYPYRNKQAVLRRK